MSVSRNKQSTIDLIRQYLKEEGIETSMKAGYVEFSPQITTGLGLTNEVFEISVWAGEEYGQYLEIASMGWLCREDDAPTFLYLCGLLERSHKLVRFKMILPEYARATVPLYLVDVPLTKSQLMHCIDALKAFIEAYSDDLHMFHIFRSPDMEEMNEEGAFRELFLDMLPTDLVQKALDLKRS